MELLTRIERRLGLRGIPNLIMYVVIGRGIAWFLEQTKPGYVSFLALDPAAILNGEYWRVLTFVFIPPDSGLLWAGISLYFTHWIGINLEATWGSFRFTIFYLFGALGTSVATFILYLTANESTFLEKAFMLGSTVSYLDLSMLLAFCTLFPENIVRFYFVIPIKMRWIGWLSSGALLAAFLLGDWYVRAAVLASIANYLLFFTSSLVSSGARIAGGSVAAVAPTLVAGLTTPAVHRCSHCAKTEKVDPSLEFRWCTCTRCGEGREYCIEHLREHLGPPAARA